MYSFTDSANLEIAKTGISIVALLVSGAAFWMGRKSYQASEKWKNAEQRIDTTEELGKLNFLIVQYQIEVDKMRDHRKRTARKLAALEAQPLSPEQKKQVDRFREPASDSQVWTHALEEAGRAKKSLDEIWSLPRSSTDLIVRVRRLSTHYAEQLAMLQNQNNQLAKIEESQNMTSN
jgi:uncharacterized coiled-coil protein SlyX